MSHEEIQDLLEDFVDDRLDRATRKTVDAHIRQCAECQAILDEVAPVDLSAIGPTRFDERTMRRMVRRSLFRTAFNAVLLLLAGWIVAWFISALIFQPLVINRGGRAVAAARATIDVTSMINPGAVVVGGQIQSGLLDRTITLEVTLPVGSGEERLDPVAVRLGASGLRGEDGAMPWRYLVESNFLGTAREQVTHLGEGTVSTIQVRYVDPISVAEAQSIADSTEFDIRVVWAGFDVVQADGTIPPWGAGGVLGYGTCLGPDGTDDEILGSSSAGFGRSVGSSAASIDDALTSVRRGLENLIEHSGLLDSLPNPGSTSLDEIGAISARLAVDPKVQTLVVTGPSDEIAAFLDSYPIEDAAGEVLAVDFYNWTSGLCGR